MQQYFGQKKDKDIILLSSEDLNHIKNVMRMKENDEVIVVYNSVSYLCTLRKDLLSAVIKEEINRLKEYPSITAYIPVLSEDKLSLIFQKGTELGINKFFVVEFQRCKFKIKNEIKEKKLKRWNKIVKEAAEQTMRIDKPVVEDIIKLEEVKGKEGVNVLCSLDTEGVKPVDEVLNHGSIYDKIILLYGPEGGITKAEEEMLVSKNFIKTSLGKNVLRSETVVLYLASIISYLRLGGKNE